MKHFIVSTIAIILSCGMTYGQEPTDSQKMLQSYADLAIGGVWKTKGVTGQPIEHTYKWILQKRFLQQTAKEGEGSGLTLIGVDPKTGSVTWWSFSADGGVGTIIMTSEAPGVWLCKGSFSGPNMDIAGTYKIVKVNDDQIRIEAISSTVNDEKQTPSEPGIWIRHEK